MRLIRLDDDASAWGLTALDSRIVWRGMSAYDRVIGHLRANDVVLDVGANTGLFCMWLDRLGIPLTVLAIEPAQQAMDCLMENMQLLKHVKVVPFRLAAHVDHLSRALAFRPRMSQASSMTGATVGATFERAGAEWAMDNHRVLRWLGPIGKWIAAVGARWYLASRVELVQCRPLAGFVNRAGHVALLKVDVEGSELVALSGVGDAWPRIDNVTVECHGGAEQALSIGAFLEGHGFAMTDAPNPDFPDMTLLSGTRVRVALVEEVV